MFCGGVDGNHSLRELEKPPPDPVSSLPERSNECMARSSDCEGMRTTVTEKIVIYTKAHCGACKRAKALLRAKGVKDWTEYDLDKFPQLKGEMIERSGGRKTVPQIFIEGKHVGGASDLYELDAARGLDPLLASVLGAAPSTS